MPGTSQLVIANVTVRIAQLMRKARIIFSSTMYTALTPRVQAAGTPYWASGLAHAD
jgi:hypothetical protein